MKKSKFVGWLRLPLACGAGFMLLYYAGWSLAGLVNNHEYFTVKEVVVKGASPDSFLQLKGENIFGLDLQEEARRVAEEYPEYKKIKFVRVLPSRVYVEFIRRKPLAYLRLYKIFYLDDEAVIFNAPQQVLNAELPLVSGLEGRIFSPRAGKQYNLKEIITALEVIHEFNRWRPLKNNYQLKRINVAEVQAASFFLLARELPAISTSAKRPVALVEIKIGQENIKEKIRTLTALLEQQQKIWYNIKYIDLRFKEPVVKFNDPQPQ